jgi:hypothetical protein
MKTRTLETDRRADGTPDIDNISLQNMPRTQWAKGAKIFVSDRDFSTSDRRPSDDGRLYSPDGE